MFCQLIRVVAELRVHSVGGGIRRPGFKSWSHPLVDDIVQVTKLSLVFVSPHVKNSNIHLVIKWIVHISTCTGPGSLSSQGFSVISLNKLILGDHADVIFRIISDPSGWWHL